MADYVQNKFLDELGQEFAEPIGFRNTDNLVPEIIIENMKTVCENDEIPASFRVAEVEISKGIFNKATFKAVEISHPNPPQSYCNQLYILYPDGIRFFYVGSSKAFLEMNNYADAMAGRGGGFKARLNAFAGIRPDEEPYEEEMKWHEAVYSVFLSLLE